MEATLRPTQPRTDAVTAEEVCRVYAPSVCRFAALMAGRAQDAEDLAQEALLRAVRSVRSYDPSRGSMEAWLWRIVANAASDAAGRRRRLGELIVRLGVLTPRASDSVEDVVVTRVRDAELRLQVGRLPVRDQTLLALRYGADLDIETVGAALGLSADSAGKAIRRALARLRARLEETRP